MNETASSIHLILAALILGTDLIAAGIMFVVLQRREHPLTYIVPAFFVIAGIVSAALVYFKLGQPPQ